MIHAILAIIFCLIILVFRFPAFATLWPGVFYISREFAQAEYRYVLKHCHGSFAHMPTFAGFYPEVWNTKSILDWVLPTIVSLAFYYYLKYRQAKR